MEIIDSPINYSGNKYKIMKFIKPLIPSNINVFYDLFCGGGSVLANIKSNKTIANDINSFIVDILEYFNNNDPHKVICEIESIIKEHKLSKLNKDTYNRFREYYNNTDNSPINLFVLSCFSFNYQFRFNSKGKYNNSSGYMCNEYNNRIGNNIIKFSNRLRSKEVKFTNTNVFDVDISNIKTDDFVYVDPPYTNSTASYNDNRRFFGGWTKDDDANLFNMLDQLNTRGIRWAMSNAFTNNGTTNRELVGWASNYNVHKLKHNIYKSNYQRKNKGQTIEVLITNYKTKQQLSIF